MNAGIQATQRAVLRPGTAVQGRRPARHELPARGTGPTAPSPADIAEELSAWVVGGGAVTMALFPLALPFLILLAIPLALPALLGGLAVVAVGVPVLLLRGLGRRLIRAVRRLRKAQRSVRAFPGGMPPAGGWQS